MTKIIYLKELVGDFAENKDIAKKLRLEEIMPALSAHQEIELNFEGMSGATQSFIHALISEPIRQFGDIAFDNLIYKNANADIREVISIVYRYMQESLSEDNDRQ